MTALSFTREPLPERFCNLDRLLHEMETRGLDGVVVTAPNNVFYLTGFNGIAHKSDEPRPYACVLSRYAPDDIILIVADYYINTAASQPSWVQDVRSFRAVMMPLDLPAAPGDVERFIPASASDKPWMANLKSTFAGGLGGAVTRALGDLGLDRGRVGFDDLRDRARLVVQPPAERVPRDALHCNEHLAVLLAHVIHARAPRMIPFRGTSRLVPKAPNHVFVDVVL